MRSYLAGEKKRVEGPFIVGGMRAALFWRNSVPGEGERGGDITSNVANGRPANEAIDFAGTAAIVGYRDGVSQQTVAAAGELVETVHQTVRGCAAGKDHNARVASAHGSVTSSGRE